MAESSADRIKNLKAHNAEYERQLNNLKNKNDAEQRSIVLGQQALNNQKLISELIKDQGDNVDKHAKEIDKLLTEEKKITNEQKKINDQLQEGIKRRQRHVDLVKHLIEQLKLGWKYLQDQDKIIKSTNLNLGISGNKAVMMRDAFEKSAGYVTRLGGTIADIQGIMQGYADETGRARVMSSEMVKDITAIGKGTGLGIEQATRLGAQFELMGFDAKSTMDYVQGVVDTSERMGVNTTKVLKVVNDNFKKLNTYTFQQGVSGFAEMAMYAEKFRMDIGQALNAADVARSLEGAIDLAANLQIMGGEFAKTDPFEMLFLARNDPAKFTVKIADMTKGLISFRKMADGTFEKFISPADRDRIAAVAKSMNMEASELTVIAERQAEIQRMRQQMAGMGLSNKEKELIEGAAIFNKETGKFQVELGGHIKNIAELTKNQANSFVKEQVMLEERAKQAMTFDDTFKATIESLKATLLPMLKGVNWILDKVMKPIADFAAKGWGGAATAAALLISAGLLWKGVASSLFRVGTKWVGQGGGKGFIGGALGGKSRIATGGITGGQPGSMFTKTGMIRKGAGSLQRGMGAKALGKGAGMGVAMAGSGAGIMLAAKGISQLADSMSKLTPEQAENLAKVVKSLSWFMIGAAAAAIGIMALGAAGTVGAVGLLAFGASMALIGGGIYLATIGISKMATGLAELNKSGGGAGKELLGVAGGIVAITLAMGGGGIIGINRFNAGLKKMSKRSVDIEKIGIAFANIQTVLSGTKEDFIAVENAIESIGNINIRGSGMFAELSNLLKKPLQVEFSKSNMILKNDITLQIDKSTFMHKIFDPQIAIQMQENLRIGK